MSNDCPSCGSAHEETLLVNGLCPSCVARSMKSGLLDLLDEPTAEKEAVTLKIDGYEVHELIGGGGMGEVYRAKRLLDGQVVAIKVVAGRLTRDPEVTARTRDLLSKFTLPVMTMDLGWSDLLTLMQGDKKSRAQELRFIGLETISRPIWFESVPVEVAAKVYGRITQ
jgi:serine/threonine protein kinase